MDTYEYIDKTGKKSTVKAGTAADALKIATNIDPKSGVALVSPYVSSLNTTKEEPRTEPAVISSQSGKDILDSEKKNQEKDMERIRMGQLREKENPSSYDNSKSYSYDEAKSAGIDFNTASFDPKSGRFIPSAEDSSATDDAQYKSDIDEIDRVFGNQEDMFDDAQKSVLSSIKGIYRQLAEETRETNKRSLASFQNLGIREGTARYAGAINQGILGSEERAGLKRLEDLAVKETSAIASAQQAYADKKYTLFADKRAELTKIREARQKDIEKIRDIALKRKEAAETAKIQASRDNAVAGLLSQGITDPKEILSTLNQTDFSGESGGFTAEEIKKSIKNLTGDTEGLSAEFKDYFALKNMGALPESISRLPENQQIMAWKNLMKTTKGTGSGGVTNVFTRAEAIKEGLPISVVGMSEDEVLGSLEAETPPAWFIEKAKHDYPNIRPYSAGLLWSEFRQKQLEKFYNPEDGEEKLTTDEKSVENNTNRAKRYFQSAYGNQVSEEDITALADQVQFYIDGGMSYSKAIEQVIEDASE
jgi:hypothetical protein